MARNKVNQHVIGSWNNRRYFMYMVSIFSMIVVIISLAVGDSSTVKEIAVQSSFWLLFGITLLYVFGVTIQDVIALKNGFGYGNNNNSNVNKEVLETDTTSPVDNRSNVDGKPL